MHLSAAFTYAVGFAAQALFAARMLSQWLLSERQHRVVSPNVFWVCSLAGSMLFFTYGVLRDDFSIILGQVLSYYIYIWNLDAKGLWRRVHPALRALILVLPVVAIGCMLTDAATFVQNFLRNADVPLWLLVFGSAGQTILALRFVYQWYFSFRHHESALPRGFWGISLTGAAIVLTYGVIRLDPVLILAHAFGILTYVRNLMILRRQTP